MGKSSCLAAVSLQWVASGHSAHHNNDHSLPGAPAAAEQFSAQAVRLLCEHRSAFTLISQDTRTIPHMCKFHLDIQLFLMGGSLALIGFIPCSQPLSCPFPESQGLLCQRLTASSKHGLAPVILPRTMLLRWLTVEKRGDYRQHWGTHALVSSSSFGFSPSNIEMMPQLSGKPHSLPEVTVTSP